MTTWLVASALVLGGLAVTLYALFSGGNTGSRGPREPEWLVPSPVEVRRVRFPLAWRGYDPAHVDVYIDALAAAYEELYFTAGPSAAARARERLALRLGQGASDPPVGPSAQGADGGTADPDVAEEP